jgi:hypothetical protein
VPAVTTAVHTRGKRIGALGLPPGTAAASRYWVAIGGCTAVPAATTAVHTRGKHVGTLGLPPVQLTPAGTG